MNKFFLIHLILLNITIFTFANVKFSSESVEIHFPNIVIASGNTTFQNEEININADQFHYDSNELEGRFKKNVKINYKNSALSGDQIFLNLKKKEITGKGNIFLKTHGFKATSDDLVISDYKLAYLKNNVQIKRNGSQISSNELIYNLETDSIISTERVKLKFKE